MLLSNLSPRLNKILKKIGLDDPGVLLMWEIDNVIGATIFINTLPGVHFF